MFRGKDGCDSIRKWLARCNVLGDKVGDTVVHVVCRGMEENVFKVPSACFVSVVHKALPRMPAEFEF